MKKFLCILSVLLLGGVAVEAEAADTIDFATQIQPILAENCYKCHGPNEQKHDLRLDSAEAILEGAGGEQIVVPGKADESEIVHMITLPEDDPDRMPRDDDPLTAEQIELIKTWINQGASFTPDPASLEKIDFAAHVRPILSQSCYECHGPETQKGDLRLDQKETIMAGEYTVIPGDAIGSDLFFRVTLPVDDADVMPPEGEGEHLTAAQQTIIERWIKEGADFGDWTVDQEVLLAQEAKRNALPQVPPADEKAMEMLRQVGALAMPLAQDTNLITVDFRAAADTIGDSHLDYLKPVAEQVMWLNLAGTKVTDAGLAKLAGFPNLRRLHLENTSITDAGLAHLKGLGELRYLNLYGTKVTNIGLIHLTGLAKLNKLFLWQTQVTEPGVKALEQAVPTLSANIGWEQAAEEAAPEEAAAEEQAESEEAESEEAEAEEEEAEPQASAKPINAKCPVSGEPIDLAQTVTFQGQVIGLCCGNCKAKFEADPEAFIAMVEGFEKGQE